MPISDKVIELVPAGKSKNKIIAFIVVAAVCLALAVTFLVLYLVKPSVEELPKVINDVTLSTTDLFSIEEDGKQVNYAVVGETYTLSATVSAENASNGVRWEVSPQSAVSIEESSTGEGGNDENPASFKFIPNLSAEGQEITVTARSMSDTQKSASVTFKAVLQGAESIVATRYYAGNDYANSTTVSNSSVSIPYYTTDGNNKTYTMLFDQYGKYNAVTQKYLPLSSIKTKDENGTEVSVNAVTVSSSDDSCIEVLSYTDHSFSFRAKGEGHATISITANMYNSSSEYVEKITVNAESNVTLGYAEKVYIFNKPVVDAEFIEKVAQGNNINATALAAIIKEDSTLTYNTTFTLPYNIQYTNIFDHVLVTPLSIQYDATKKEIKENWYSSFEVTSSNTNVLTARTSNGVCTLVTSQLASKATDANACKLTVTDGKAGGIRTSASVDMIVVAKNSIKEDNSVTATVGGTDYKVGSTVTVTPGGSSTLTVKYVLSMPGKIDTTNLIDLGYINNMIEFEYNSDEVTVKRKGSDIVIKPSEPVSFPEGSMTFVGQGNETNSARTFYGTIVFDITTSSELFDGAEFKITFRKVGSFLDDDGTWEYTFNYNVEKRATEAMFVSETEAQSIVTAKGTNIGKFVQSDIDKTKADIYVQNLHVTDAFESIYDIKSLVRSDGAYSVLLKYTENNNSAVFSRKANNQGDDTLLFENASSSLSSSAISAVATLTVSDIEGKELDKFTVNIHVIDAVTGFASIDTKNATYKASSNGDGILLPTGDIKVTRVFDTVAAQYNGTVTKELYYTDADGKSCKFDSATTGTTTTYSYTADGKTYDIYKFETNRLTPLRDLMALGYITGIDFSRIVVYYLLPEDEYYVPVTTDTPNIDGVPFGYVYCNFSRDLDGVKVAASESVSDDGLLYNEGDNYTLRAVPQFKFTVDGESVEIDADNEKCVALYSDNYYIVVSNSQTAAGDLVKQDGQYNYYRYVTVTAKRFGSELSETQAFGYGYGDNATTSFNVTIQNMLRSIKSIVLQDGNGNTLSSEVVFGKFDGVETYQLTVHIVVTYVAYNENHQNFESVQMSVPEYLSVNGGDSGDVLLTVPSTVDIKSVSNGGPEFVQEFVCVFELNEKAVQGASKPISLRPSVTQLESREIGVDTSVDTGLHRITITDANNQDYAIFGGYAQTVNVALELKDALSAPQYRFDIAYGALINEKYSGVSYNTSLDSLGISYSAVDGLKFIDNLRNEKYGTLTVDINDLQTLNKTFTITFTDKVQGKNIVFTLNINVSVTADIYSLAFDGDTSFIVETTGGSGDQTQNVVIKYNNGTAALQPSEKKKDDVTVKLVTGETDNAYTGTDYRLTKNEDGTISLSVANSVLTSSNVYVRIAYSGLVAYKPVLIQSKSHYLAFVDGIDMDLTADGEGAYKAAVVVDSAAQSFNLGAVVKDSGTNVVLTGKTIAYKLFTSDSYTGAAPSFATVGADGTIKITPNAASGTLYFLASYTDDTNTVRTLKVAVTYYVKVTGVEINGIDTNTMSGSTLNLYYLDSADYTYIDLASFIKASNAFGHAFGNDLNVTVTASNGNIIDVSGTEVRPKAAGTSNITVKASYGLSTNTIDSRTYSVVVKNIGSALTLNSAVGSVDISTGTSATVTATYESINGFTAAYTLTGDSAVTISGEGNVKTLTAARSSSTKNSYALTAKVVYTKASGTSASVHGAIELVKTYTLNVICEAYTPAFALYKDGAIIEAGATVAYDSAATYTIKITNFDSNATYTASSNGVLKIGTFDNSGVATVTLNANSSGNDVVKVSASMFGKTLPYSATHSYTFTYGIDAEAKLYLGNTEFVGTTQAIDFTTDKKVFTYRITGLAANVNLSDVHIIVSGGTMGTPAKNGNDPYVNITVDTIGTLTVGGYVVVGSTTVYLATYTVELTATAPTFAFTDSVSSLNAAQSGTLAVANGASAFMGGYSTVYDIVSGGDYATINASTGALTAKSIVSDGVVTVRATITVNSGVYKDNKFTVTKEIVIKGKPLPTITLSGDMNVEAGKSYTYNYSVNAGYTVGTDITISDCYVHQNTTLQGSDYSFNTTNRTLAINNTDNVKAGGKIVLYIKATVTSGAHTGEIAENIIEIIVAPSFDVVENVTIGNAATTIDLAGYMTVHVYDSNYSICTNDGVVKSLSFVDAQHNNVTVDGSKLILSDNLTAGTSIKLNAIVTVTSGAFAGTVMEKQFTVNVGGLPFTVSSLAAQWSNNGYADVNVNNAIRANSGVSLDSVTVNALSGGSLIAISGTTITVNADANTYVSGSGVSAPSDKTVDLEYTVVVGGNTYYATGTLSVPAVAISVTATSLGANVSDSGLQYYTGDTFDITFNADKSVFDVVIDSVSITYNNASTQDITATFAGNKAMFVVSGSISDGTYYAAITFTVGGVASERTIGITITAPSATTAYTADKTENEFKTGENGTVVSEWTYVSSNSPYKYGYSVTVSVPSGTLSDYFESIGISTNGVSTTSTVSNLNASSATLRFNSGNTLYVLNTFYVHFKYKTDKAIARTPITVTYLAYNTYSANSWTARSSEISLRYYITVINEYTVSFDANGGTLADNAPLKVVGGGTYGILPTPTREHYNFDGWFTARNGGSQVTRNTEVNSDQTLYAHWTAKTYDITFVLNGGTPAAGNNGTVNIEDGYSLPADPTRANYVFNGWYAPDGTKIINNASVSGTLYTVLYAQWTGKDITVKFVSDDGVAFDSNVADITVKYNEVYGDLATPTASGYTFDGWYLGDTLITSGTLVTETTDTVTLTAKWTKVPDPAPVYYTVTLNAGEGMFGTAKTLTFTVKSGEAFTMHGLLTPTRDGYTFDGWYISETEAAGDSVTVGSDITLTAHWVKEEVGE